MSCMFSSCSLLSSLPDLYKWNTSNVSDKHGMFCYCSSLPTWPYLSKRNTSNVSDMNEIFCKCTSLKDKNISYFNINNKANIYCINFGISTDIQSEIKIQNKNIKEDAFKN